MPKKKGAKKGAKVIDGVATNEMTREQLLGHVKRMQLELDREREERNFFMLEREKLYTLWTTTMEQLAAAKTDADVAVVRMDEGEREQEKDMNLYKQKLRFLLSEQSHKIAETYLQNFKRIRQLNDDADRMQWLLRKIIEEKKAEISHQKTKMCEMVRRLRLENAENVSKLRHEFSSEIRSLEAFFERMLFQRDELQTLEEATEIRRTEQEKSHHINQLVEVHEQQISNMKEYFTEISAYNFAVIAALKQEIQNMRTQEEHLRAQISRAQVEKKELQEKLDKAKSELESKTVAEGQREKQLQQQLRSSERILKQFQKQQRFLETNNEVLVQRALKAESDKNQLKSSFAKEILNIQKQTAMKNLLLELKLSSLTPKNEVKFSDASKHRREKSRVVELFETVAEESPQEEDLSIQSERPPNDN